MKPLFILSEGAWGTAIATVLAHNGHTVYLWCHDTTVAHMIQQKRINERYLPGIVLSEKIIPVTDFSVLPDIELIFQAIPLVYLRSVLQSIQPHIKTHHRWITLSKGIEQHSLFTTTQIIADVIKIPSVKAVLSGPSFAKDVAEKKRTGVMLATPEKRAFNHISSIISNDYFKLFYTADVMGVEWCGALKNVLTLTLALLEGAGYSANERAFIFTKGLEEIARIVQFFSGDSNTVYGLAGIGDVMLTALSPQSRNMQVGHMLAAGESLPNILAKTGYTPEGINTVQSVYQLITQKNIQAPLFAATYEVIFQKASVEILFDCF